MAKDFKLLVKVGEKVVGKVAKHDMYHVFPCADAIQEKHFKPFNTIHDKRMYLVKKLPQKDGSRFYALWSRYTVYDVREKLQGIIQTPIYMPVSFRQDELLDFFHNTGMMLLTGIERGEVEYLSYWTHSFLNGKRVIPLLVDHMSQTVMDITPVFPELAAEDGMGVLIQDIAELNIGSLINIPPTTRIYGPLNILPTTIRYFSSIRMCASCGVVSDHGEALDKPWLEKMMARARKKLR